MIGQKSLIQHLNAIVANNAMHHFCIFTGPKGSGRKTLINHIVNQAGIMSAVQDISVSSIRSMIENAYKNTEPIVYIIPDADSMSLQAKNAMLKVAEEPPNKAYFFMSLEDINNTLPTIKSRATVYRMENYSREELEEYAQQTYQDNHEIYFKLCDTPGEIDLLYKMSVLDFYSYVEKVVDNIAEVSSANSFKIVDKIAIKEDDTKYDLKLFFKAFMTVCIERMVEEPIEYARGVAITSKYLQELGIKGVNKQMLFDAWLLDIRSAWMEG